MEAEYNFNNKILALDLMKCRERCGNTPKEKYVSRKGKKLFILSTNNCFTA